MTDILEVQDQAANSGEKSVSVPAAVDEKVEGDETPSKELDVGASALLAIFLYGCPSLESFIGRQCH